MPRSATVRLLATLIAVSCAGACGDQESVAPLQARKAQLEREVAGLRDIAAHLASGAPLIDETDLVVSLDESFVRGLVAAQLPLTIHASPYRLTLTEAEVGFTGTSVVRLRGTVVREGSVTLDAAATALGSVTGITVDAESSTLHAVVGIDHLDIERIAGIEAFLSGATLDDVSERVRAQLAADLPVIRIPVRVHQEVVMPSLTDGPVRVAGATLPIDARVARVFAGNRRLWITIAVSIGEAGS